MAATGYSFPSGHTMSGTSTYGTTIAMQRKKRKGAAVFCGVMIALTGFSRNFLGVHTPQDVVVGFSEAVAIIIIVGICQRKIAGNERTLDILSLAGVFAPATFVAALGGHWGNLVSRFILWFFVVAVWPVFIRKWAEG